MKKIAIYGAGVYGKAMMYIMLKMGVDVDCFIQTNKPEREALDDIPIYSVDEFFKVIKGNDSWSFAIAIDNVNVCNQIKSRLQKKGIDDKDIIFATSFVKDNISIVSNQYCPICKKYTFFLPYSGDGDNQEFFDRYGVVGGGYRDNAICSNCRRIDRHRFSYLVAQKYINELLDRNEQIDVLHFAPEYDLSDINHECIHYVKADLVPRDNTVEKVDVTDIKFDENSFDIIVINHVLEHILDEKKAISELVRVVRNHGKIICSFPIAHNLLKTIETETLLPPEELLARYGQRDHVRLYGNDFKERIERMGGKVNVLKTGDVISHELIQKYGLLQEDMVVVIEKG